MKTAQVKQYLPDKPIPTEGTEILLCSLSYSAVKAGLEE